MKITFGSTKYSNAYKVWKNSPNGGKRVIGTVAKLQGDDFWTYRRGDDYYTGATRKDAVLSAY